MPRRGPGRITVIGVGTPPPLPLRPLAMDILRIWEAKQAAGRQAKEIAAEDRAGSARKRSGPAPQRAREPLGSRFAPSRRSHFHAQFGRSWPL